LISIKKGSNRVRLRLQSRHPPRRAAFAQLAQPCAAFAAFSCSAPYHSESDSSISAWPSAERHL